MSQKSGLALSVKATTSADQQTMLDAACKRLLANKQVISRILKTVVSECKDMTENEIQLCISDTEISRVPVRPGETAEPDHIREDIIGDNTESKILHEGNLYYDVRFHILIPEKSEKVNQENIVSIKLYFDLEAQNNIYAGYPIPSRSIVYSARMISEQFGKEFDDKTYGDLKKVYSIWIMPQAPKYLDGTIEYFHISRELLCGTFPKKEKTEDYDKMSIILIYIDGTHISEDTYDKYDELLTPLSLLFSNNSGADEKERILQNDYGFIMDQEMSKEVNSMCNLSQGILKQGIEQGIEQKTKSVTINMIREGLSDGIILSITGISQEKLNEIKDQVFETV